MLSDVVSDADVEGPTEDRPLDTAPVVVKASESVSVKLVDVEVIVVALLVLVLSAGEVVLSLGIEVNPGKNVSVFKMVDPKASGLEAVMVLSTDTEVEVSTGSELRPFDTIPVVVVVVVVAIVVAAVAVSLRVPC